MFNCLVAMTPQLLIHTTRGDYFLSYSRGWLTSFYTGFDIEAS